MMLQVDCYTKEEYSVQLDSSGNYPIPSGEQRELFLFACYALRQLRNLQGHIVGDALAGLLDLITPLSLWGFSGEGLLAANHKHRLVARGMSEDEAQIERDKVFHQLLDRPDRNIEYLNNEYLAHLPNLRLTTHHGDARRQIIMTLPPLSVKLKGFGLLFGDGRYYALVSTVALSQFLFKKHKRGGNFHVKLMGVSSICAGAYLFNKIPTDQESLARNIVTGLAETGKQFPRI